MKWTIQWASDGDVFDLPYFRDAEESACLRIALANFIISLSYNE